MRKRNLILPLFLASFFITSNVDSSVIDLYETKSKSDFLIAGGDCGGSGSGGGMSPAERKKRKERQQKVKDDAKKRIIKSKIAAGKPLTDEEKKIIELNPNDFPLIDEIIGGDPNTWGRVNFKDLNINQINILKEKIDPMMILIWEPYRRLAEENKRRQESGEYEDGEYMELMGEGAMSLL